jgi:hypothetical protein
VFLHAVGCPGRGGSGGVLVTRRADRTGGVPAHRCAVLPTGVWQLVTALRLHRAGPAPGTRPLGSTGGNLPWRRGRSRGADGVLLRALPLRPVLARADAAPLLGHRLAQRLAGHVPGAWGLLGSGLFARAR